jgi:acyl carrier protein
MCSNPLPPAQRKVGSVGLPAGPEVAVMDEGGRLVAPGVVGEVVIRGANVTPGYENNPTANASSFTEGWFRTGDQGYQDADGYLFLTGRLKELINRGGEKIVPREVDEALMTHPAVAQAVAFAVPHERLGEDVAAAVVMRPGVSATDGELRQFALERLAPHKVPSRIVFVDTIPKGPTGKLQRIGLHKVLAPLLEVEFVPPGDPVEEAVARLWCEVLERDRIGVHDNFFYIGGDSLLATRVLTRVRSVFEIELPIEIMFRMPTIAEQALVIEERLVEAVERLPSE